MTKSQHTQPELLAPAGSFASLHAAIEAGADAIYFGVEGLNMRNRSANNFALADIAQIVALCATSGVRAYLALNTVLYDGELEQAASTLATAKAAGVDAIIASDVAVMQLANSLGLSVHLSTQLNISNVAALKFYAQFADVVVLARELDLGQVCAIADAISTQQITGPSGQPVKIEMFCHGALCMASSGRCFMSLHLYNASANRGDCLQVCRRSYTAHDTVTGEELAIDNEFVMSPKDLKTIHFLAEMVHAGVRVFKIEGRARSADYVHTVVGCYREALDALAGATVAGTAETAGAAGSAGAAGAAGADADARAAGSAAATDAPADATITDADGFARHTPEQIAAWDTRLARVFNRGFWDGYYLGQKTGERTPFYNSQATRTKVLLGKCDNYYGKISVAKFTLEGGDLSVGDEVVVIGHTSGVLEATIESLVVEKQSVRHAAKGSVVTFPTAKRIRRDDKLYKLVPAD